MIRATGLLLFGTVLAFLGLPGVSLAGHDRPFKGALVTTATNFTLLDDGVLQIDGVISGQATIAGKLTGSFTYYVNPDFTFSGTLTKVAANGDEIHETFVGYFDSPTTSVGEFTIVGGTGRFANASGGGTFSGLVASEVEIDIVFSGTISGPK
jgi:hypothetical protein